MYRRPALGRAAELGFNINFHYFPLKDDIKWSSISVPAMQRLLEIYEGNLISLRELLLHTLPSW